MWATTLRSGRVEPIRRFGAGGGPGIPEGGSEGVLCSSARAVPGHDETELHRHGVYIIALLTDPPLHACAFYSGGEYTSVVYPCTEIVLPDGGTIDMGGPFWTREMQARPGSHRRKRVTWSPDVGGE